MTVNRVRRKTQRDSQTKVIITNWQHVEEPNPAFERLMMILLQERKGNGEKADEREYDRPNR